MNAKMEPVYEDGDVVNY